MTLWGWYCHANPTTYVHHVQVDIITNFTKYRHNNDKSTLWNWTFCTNLTRYLQLETTMITRRCNTGTAAKNVQLETTVITRRCSTGAAARRYNDVPAAGDNDGQ